MKSKEFEIILGTACEVRTEFYTEDFNTLRTGDADLRFYVTTVQDG